MKPMPEPISVSLNRRISDLFVESQKTGGVAQHFVFRRLLADAGQLCRTAEFAVEGYAFMGILHAMNADKASSDEAFSKAERLFSSPSKKYLEYKSNADTLLGRFASCKNIVETYFYDEQDPNTLAMLLKLSLGSGAFQMAKRFFARLESMQMLDILNQSTKDAYQDFQALERLGVSEQDFIDRLQVAADVVFKKLNQCFWHYSINDTPSGLAFSFTLVGSPEKLVELDWDIAEAIVESFEDPMGDKFTFSTSPHRVTE